ncbi:MAG: hypothetical protein KBA66_19180 [Leptospiraceae bacterium]|nr:hypothetical protein [Leptospiraceae bacterium]
MATETFTEHVFDLITGIEGYQSPYAETIGDPAIIAEELTQSAALKTAGISAGLSLPTGVFSIFTILPELFMVYRIQGHLIKDIASLYGKEALVTKELLIYCMFKQTSLHLVERLLEDVGTKIIIRPTTIRFIESILQKIGLNLSKNLIRKQMLKWLPLLGAALTGGFTYLDTKYIAATATGLFAKDILVESGEIKEVE